MLRLHRHHSGSSSQGSVLLSRMPGEKELGNAAVRPDLAAIQVGSEGWCGSVGGVVRWFILSLWLQLRVQRVNDFPGSGAAGCGGVFAAVLIPQPKTAERADNGCGGEESSQGSSQIPTFLCVRWWQRDTAQLAAPGSTW